MPNFTNFKVLKLPSSEPKSAVFRRFINCCLEIELAHLNEATAERQFYQNCCKIEDTATASQLVLSFDYAQNVSYGRSPQ